MVVVTTGCDMLVTGCIVIVVATSLASDVGAADQKGGVLKFVRVAVVSGGSLN